MISGSMTPLSSMSMEQIQQQAASKFSSSRSGLINPRTSKLMYPSLSEKQPSEITQPSEFTQPSGFVEPSEFMKPTGMTQPSGFMQPSSEFMQPNSFEGQLFNTVLEKIAEKIVEIPDEPDKSSNTSYSNTTRFFRDLGKKSVNTIEPSNTESKIKGPSSKELKEISRINWRAYIESGWFAAMFGSTAAYIMYYINFAISLAFKLFILFIIFNICVIIYKAIQKILDVSHTVMGGVKNSISGINNLLNQIGINFVVPGISIPAIRFRTGDLFKLNWYPFKNSLGGPLNKIDSAVRAIPRDATDVIINMIREMLVGLIDLMPKLFDGMIQTFEKIMK